ncbi:MAG: ABC transporter substrate-binding protein [Chloroflexi bacterium]|nr:ABC transporter substrate-binding protein [Chloroflexota bacterium]
MDALVAAAKQEGELTVIALPDTWCDYGDMKAQFIAKYGIKINDLNPNGSSGQEIEAITANKDNKGPQAPDVIDVGLGFGPQIVQDKLVTPYKVATWNEIPDSAKDPNGYWYGDYYGVMAFEVNSDVIKNPPQDWSDLLKPEYKNSVALSGDPRQAAQAIQGVFAAGLAADGGDIAKAGDAGLQFFSQLNKAGNFVPVVGIVGTVAKGETPINIQWDYLSLADNDTLKGNPKIDTIVPKSGVVAGIYIQAISAYAPHPNAAKLWMEYLYSDEGQNTWLKGYCHPIRFNAMAQANKLPADLMAKLPPADNYAKAVFPTLDQQAAYKDTITKNWDSVVGANVQKSQ